MIYHEAQNFMEAQKGETQNFMEAQKGETQNFMEAQKNTGVRRRAIGVLFGMGAVVLLAGCNSDRDRTVSNRQWSDSFAFRITVEPTPPRAIEDAVYRIVVTDKATNEPIETGEGRIFATSPDGANTDDGLLKGKEVGTYYGRLFFPTTGDWAVALQFRRDSTQRLERVDWIQGVNNPTGDPTSK